MYCAHCLLHGCNFGWLESSEITIFSWSLVGGVRDGSSWVLVDFQTKDYRVFT